MARDNYRLARLVVHTDQGIRSRGKTMRRMQKSCSARSHTAVVVLMALTIAAAAALLLTACGSSSGSTSTTSSSPTALAAVVGEAAGDIDQLTWDSPYGEPDTLDPRNAVWYPNLLLTGNLVDTLVRTTPEGEMAPGIAESWSQPDDKTLVLKIREDVKFWDGNQLTAADVVYSLQRAGAPDSYTAANYTFVKAIKATGDYEVTVSFKSPDELFLKEMATGSGGIIEKKWAEKAGKSVGTPKGGIMASGPFKLEKWTPGQSIELSRNDLYWDSAYRAHAAAVSVKFVSDSTALAQALIAGEIDGAYEVPASIIPRLSDSSTGALQLGPSQQFLEFGRIRPDGPLANAKLCEGLFKAVDREGLAKVIFNGAAEANYTMLSPGIWDPEAYDQWKQAYQPYVQANAYDVEAAKKLVAESGYSGEPIQLVIQAGDSTQEQTGQLIQEEARAVGITIEIKTLQPLEYSNIWIDPQARKPYDLYVVMAFNGRPDPVELLNFVFVTPVYNYTEYNNPQVTALIEEARASSDPAKRTDLLIQAQTIYEPDNVLTSLVMPYEISYLNGDYTGMITSFNYAFLPSLATIGSAK